MFNFAHQRAREVLSLTRKVVLATGGPAGVLAGEFRCEAVDLALFLLVPKTSDHLFNLEHDSSVTVLSAGWEMKGNAQVISEEMLEFKLDLLQDPGARWCKLVRVDPLLLQVRRSEGWGNLETIDLKESGLN